MSSYMTEEEQLEAIKKWWQRHQYKLITVLSFILLLTAGYKYWFIHKEKLTAQASNQYELMMLAFSNNDDKKVQSYASSLIKEHSSSVYADVAHLLMAKIEFNNRHTPQATQHLAYVANDSTLPVLQQVAKIRWARLLLANKSYEKAQALLSPITQPAFTPVINELQGDIYSAKGHYTKAMACYQQAMSSFHQEGMNNLLLEMKMNEVAALGAKNKA